MDAVEEVSDAAERPASRESPIRGVRPHTSGRPSNATGLHSPMRAARKRSVVAIEQRMLGGEYRVFPLSKYQGDGWEPFLPKNPLEGTTFEGIAKDFEARRRRLDVVRNQTLLRGDEDDDWKKIASKRTARRLAKEGIAADGTGMGLFSKGVYLIDDKEEQYLEPPWHEPTQDQIKRFLRAEKKRVWTHDGRLDALVQRKLKETKNNDEEEDEGYEQFEEDDYRTALRVLARLQSRPRILCCSITLTGSGAAHFVTTDKRLRNRSWVIFRRSMAESLGLSDFEIAIVSATTTTEGTQLSESVDVDFRICTPDAELAEVLAEMIEECVEDRSLGRTLTQFNLQSQTSIRKGPAIFEFPGGYDFTDRLFGEQAVELRRQIEAWDYELTKKRHKTHRKLDSLSAHDETQIYHDDDVEPAPDCTVALTPVGPQRRKRFKVTAGGDTLEQDDEILISPRPAHGFALQPRPQSSLDRIQAYAQLQSSHAMDTVKRPKSEAAMRRDEKEVPCDRVGVGVQPHGVVAANDRLAEYFKSRVGKKAAPQRGDLTTKTKEIRHAFDASKAENRARLKEEEHLRAKHHQERLSRSRSLGRWDDEPKPVSEVEAMGAVLPSIEHTIQKARFNVQARGSPAAQSRIHASSLLSGAPDSPAPPGSPARSAASEKSGLAALSLPRHISEAVQASEIGLEDVMQCTEEELMELTGLGQLDCWRLKKKLAQHEEHRQSSPMAIRERARIAAEERRQLQNVRSRVNVGSREEARAHQEAERARVREREHQMQEERRQLARESHLEHQRLHSIRASVDTRSKVPYPRSVAEQRSGLSAFSEHSDHSIGWGAEHGSDRDRDYGQDSHAGADTPPSEGPSDQGSAARGAAEEGQETVEGRHNGGEQAVPGAPSSMVQRPSKRHLLVQGSGHGPAQKGVPVKRGHAASGASQAESTAQRGLGPTLEGSDAFSVQAIATPSRKDSFRKSRSPTRQGSMRKSRSGLRGTSRRSHADNEDPGSDGSSGVSPFPEGLEEEPSQETLMMASQSPLGARDPIPETSPVRASQADPPHAKAHHKKERHHSRSSSPAPRKSDRHAITSPPPRRVNPPRTHGPKITLRGSWSNLLNDVLPDSSKAKPTMKKHSGEKVKKRHRRHLSAHGHSSGDDNESIASLESIREPEVSSGPCLCCKGTKKLVLADLPEYLQEILPAIEKMEVACPLCCPMPRFEVTNAPASKKPFTLKPWKAKQHCPEVGTGLVVIEEDSDEEGEGRQKQKRSVAGIAVDVKAVSVVVVFSNGQLEEYELATGALVHTVHVPVATAIFSVCKHNDMLYLGMDSVIQEVSLAPNATPTRKLKGQDGDILCISTTGEESNLVSGSRNQTTFIWDLTSGKVLHSRIVLEDELPKPLKSFAEGWPSRTQAYAFRHHTGPVSCCAAGKGVLITGGWDGLLCVVFFNAYKDRWQDEQTAILLREKKAELKQHSKQLQKEMATFAASRKGARTKKKLELEISKTETTLSLVSNTLVSTDARLKVALQRCRKFLYEPTRDVGRVTSLAFTALENKTYGLFAGYSDGKVRQWDVIAGTVAHVLMTWTPMSVTSVCLGIGRVYCGYANGLIKVWDLTTLKAETIRTQKNAIDLVGHQDGVAFLRLCDNLLFSCADDSSMRTWDLLVCDPEMTLPLKPVPPSGIQRTMSMSRYARLEEVSGAVMRVISIPEHVSSTPSQTSQAGEQSEASETEQADPEPEAPPELQELSASLPFDPSVYTESKAEQNELLHELLEIGQAVESLNDSLVDQTIKARAYVLRHPNKPPSKSVRTTQAGAHE